MGMFKISKGTYLSRGEILEIAILWGKRLRSKCSWITEEYLLNPPKLTSQGPASQQKLDGPVGHTGDHLQLITGLESGEQDGSSPEASYR